MSILNNLISKLERGISTVFGKTALGSALNELNEAINHENLNFGSVHLSELDRFESIFNEEESDLALSTNSGDQNYTTNQTEEGNDEWYIGSISKEMMSKLFPKE